jgi:hypothetical protein
MFTLSPERDLQTRESRWVWNNQEEREIVILEVHQVQPFVDLRFNVSHG